MFNEVIKLKWEGEEYSCPVKMTLIKRMENAGINILQTAAKIDSGGIPPISLISEFYSFILREGGCDVTEEEVYSSIMAAPADNIAVIQAARYALQYFFPRLDSAERPSSSKKKPKK